MGVRPEIGSNFGSDLALTWDRLLIFVGVWPLTPTTDCAPMFIVTNVHIYSKVIRIKVVKKFWNSITTKNSVINNWVKLLNNGYACPTLSTRNIHSWQVLFFLCFPPVLQDHESNIIWKILIWKLLGKIILSHPGSILWRRWWLIYILY